MINALIKQERLFWGKLLCFCTVDFYYFKHRILCLKERRPANFLVYFAFASPSNGVGKIYPHSCCQLNPEFHSTISMLFLSLKKKKRNGGNLKCYRWLRLGKNAKGFSTWSGKETGEKLSSGIPVCVKLRLQFLAQTLRKTRVINSPCSPACLPSLLCWGQLMLFRAMVNHPRYIPFAILQRNENFPPQLQLMKGRSQLAPGCSGDGWVGGHSTLLAPQAIWEGMVWEDFSCAYMLTNKTASVLFSQLVFKHMLEKETLIFIAQMLMSQLLGNHKDHRPFYWINIVINWDSFESNVGWGRPEASSWL